MTPKDARGTTTGHRRAADQDGAMPRLGGWDAIGREGQTAERGRTSAATDRALGERNSRRERPTMRRGRPRTVSMDTDLHDVSTDGGRWRSTLLQPRSMSVINSSRRNPERSNFLLNSFMKRSARCGTGSRHVALGSCLQSGAYSRSHWPTRACSDRAVRREPRVVTACSQAAWTCPSRAPTSPPPTLPPP